MEIKILPHTERFIMTFNELKANKKLPSNKVLAEKIGLPGGNSLTEIKGRRQNIGLDSLQKFCDIYGPDNNFTMSTFIGTSSKDSDEKKKGQEKEDGSWERAAIKALTWKLADALSEISNLKGDPRPVTEYLTEIDKSTTLILADQRASRKK